MNAVRFLSALLLAAALASAALADDPELLRFESARFDEEGDSSFFRGRLATPLPDGGLVHLWVSYGGRVVTDLRKRFRIRGETVEFEFGPCRRRVVSGTYVLTASLDPGRQPAAYLKLLSESGRPLEGTIEAARELVARTPEISPEERSEIDEIYGQIFDKASVLLDEATGFRRAIEDEEERKKEDEKWAAWRAGLSARVRELGVLYEGLLDTYLALPEQGLVLSMGALFQHLGPIVDLVGRERAGQGPSESEGGDEMLTVDDRLHHVRQVLRGLAIHLGKAEMTDAQVFAELKVELAALLGEVAAQAKSEPTDEARATWFDEWAARVGSLGANLVVAESSEGLYVEFRRLRRDAIALGAAFRDSGTLDEVALAALREKIGVEDE